LSFRVWNRAATSANLNGYPTFAIATDRKKSAIGQA